LAIGGWLFATDALKDHRLKRQASELASRISDWTDAQLVNDPIPPGSQPGATPEQVHAHNQLWSQVARDFVQKFGAEVAQFNQTLQRQQIRHRFPGPFMGPSDIRALVRVLREFSDLEGRLSRQ
jgi:hypothetical protein